MGLEVVELNSYSMTGDRHENTILCHLEAIHLDVDVCIPLLHVYIYIYIYIYIYTNIYVIDTHFLRAFWILLGRELMSFSSVLVSV